MALKLRDREEAHRWCDSPEYQAVVGLRLAVIDGAALLCGGFGPPRA